MPRWVAPVVIATTVIVAVVVGVLWYVIGGWPRDHDRYGVVPIPGQRVLELPEGESPAGVRGECQTGAGTARSRTCPTISACGSPAAAGELRVDDVSGSLYGVFVGGRGREPFGKVEVPKRHRVRAISETASPSGEITAGPELWNPGGSRVLGAVAVFFAALIVLLFLDLPFIVLAAGPARA